MVRWLVSARAWATVGLVALAGAVVADPFPPTLTNGAAHFPPVAWPNEPANPAQCGAQCGDWQPYTRFQSGVADPRVQDPSNGGTAPQNYVNISSSCTDKTQPSIYYALRQGSAADGSQDVIMFRWRVEQIANNYATGPSAGAHGASDPWSSALWSVLFDVDGDGYLDLAAHLDGSSGAPAASIDRIAGIWSKRPTQSLDYVGDPSNVKLLAHNPTAFVDPVSGRLLNFGVRNAQNEPQANWPGGSAETVWDYGTTRAKRVTASPCNEYFIDYQIPVRMLDAGSEGGPKITRSTPISMVFCTANSLNNPFQKDCAINASWVGASARPAPFGDYVSFNQSAPYAQPIVSKVVATPPSTCPGNYTLSATVQDTLAVANGAVTPSVQSVRFYYYHDVNGNGIADDSGSWTFAADATLRPGTLNTWGGQWSGVGLPKGSYLIGVQALDDNTKVDLGVTPSGTNNRTFSYVAGDAQNRIEVAGTGYAAVPSHSPAQGEPGGGENWWGNPSVTGSQVALVGLALNSCGVAPTITKTVSQPSMAAGGNATFTITVGNTTGSPIALTRLEDALPTGFSYQSTAAFTNAGVPVGSHTAPVANAAGTVSWTPQTPLSVANNASVVLSFVARAASVSGNYNNTARAQTSYGTLTSSPVALQVDAARLSLTKTPNRYNINPDGTTQLTYTIRYANDSVVAVSAARISDVLPAGVTYAGCTGGSACSNSSGTVEWTLGALAGGATGEVAVTVTVNTSYSGTSLVNSATVYATAPDGATVSSAGSATVAVNAPAPAFTLTKAASAARVAPGGSIVWTLNYRNYGSGPASNVVVTDTLPAGTAFSSCSGNCTHSAGTVTWNLGTVAAGASASLALTTAVNASTPFTFPNPVRNSATLTWSGNATGVSATADVGITGASCSAVYYFHGPITSRTATLAAPATGNASISEQPGTATLVFPGVAPAGGINAAGKTLTISFFMASSTGNATFQVNLHNVTRNQTIASSTAQGVANSSGSPVLQTFTATVPGGVTIAAGDLLEWRFTLGGSGQLPTFWYNSPTHNSRSSICDASAPASISLSKVVDQPHVSAVPVNVQYTLVFTNTGGSDASAVTLRDTLPANVTMTGATLNNVPVNLGMAPYGNPYTFTVNSSSGASGVVKAGESGTLVIQAALGGAATGTLTNSASVAVGGSTAVTASASTVVGSLAAGGAPALSLSKSADRTSISAGGAVTYTLTLVNTGQAPASMVAVSDELPVQPYFSYGACTASVGSCAQAGGTVTWTVGTLAAGGVASATITMNAAASGVPAGVTLLNNTAIATDAAYCTGGSPPSSCRSNTVAVALSGNPILALTKAAVPATAEPGDAVAYTLVVTNSGSSAASGVVVEDAVPAHMAFAQVTGAGPGSASFDALGNRVVFQVGTLALGASATLSFQAKVQALPAGTTTIVNTASVSAQNAPGRTASATVSASAQPQLTLTKQGPTQVGYPAATLTQSASNATQLRVNDSSQVALGQYVSVGGSVARVVDLSPTTLTLASPVSAAAGSLVQAAITYTLTYQNTGKATATNVVLADTLPAGMVPLVSEPAGSVSGSTVGWALGSLEPGAAGSVQLVVLPQAPGSYVNQASIRCAPCSADVLASATTSVGGLVVTKRTTTPTVAAGGLAEYVIEVRNTAATAISSVAVTDVLATGFQYESTAAVFNNGSPVSAASAPAVGDTTLSWGGFTVQPGQTLSVRFAARVSPNAGTATYQNDAGATPQSRAVAYDFLGSTAEDVVVLGADAGLISGTVFHDADNSGSFDGSVDLPLPGVAVRFYDGGNTLVYEEVTDVAGRYARVMPAGNWSVQATASGIPAGLSLGGSYRNPATVTVAGSQGVQADMGFVNPSVLPDLVLAKTHAGNFSQGQMGAEYRLVVSNIGQGATSGQVAVTDTLPAGLVATAISGTGWNCNLAALACTRSDVLAAGASFPAITLVVSVAANAAAQVTNQAAVSGGGETHTANNSASDPTIVTAVSAVPDLTLTKTHTGNFTQGQAGAIYSLVVRNEGAGPSNGTVTVTDALPTGLAATALGGPGWTCVLATVTCTRSDVLAAGGAFPAITLTVSVAANAAAQLTNQASVIGGGETNIANNSASDPTTITAVSLPPDLSLTKSHSGNFTQGQTGAVYTLTVRNVGAGSSSGAVTVMETLPAGLTATALGGAGWTCALGSLSCTRSDVLAAGATWPAVQVTVTVSTSAAASVTNTAAVSGGGDVTPGNNVATDLTLISPCGCTVAGHVFKDLNRNGVQDAGEPPFANVQITLQQVTQGTPASQQMRRAALTKAPGGSWTTMTDANGDFSVQLPGVTTVKLFVTPPVGYTETTGTDGQTVTVGQVVAAALPVGLVPAVPTAATAIPVFGPWMWALLTLLLGGFGWCARGRRG